MLREGILDRVELLETALGLLGLTLDQDDGAGKFVGDLIAAALQVILTLGQLLETLLFLLDLILSLAKQEKLGLSPLDLTLKFFG